MDKQQVNSATTLLSLLGQHINKINQCDTTEGLLTCLQDCISMVLGFNTVWLVVFKEGDYTQAQVITMSGKHAAIVQQNAQIVSDDPFMNDIYFKSEPVYIEDMEKDSRTNKDLVVRWNSRTALCCQLHINGDAIGALCTGSFDDEGLVSLTESEISYFEALTKSTSIVLHKIQNNKLANEDALTRLLNRRGLLVQVEKLVSLAKRNNTKLGLIYADLDDFKLINDTYGHDFGDAVLKQVAYALSGAVRESDIVARTGGDEFIVVLNDIKDPSSILDIIADVRSKLEVSNKTEVQHKLSMSFGYAFYPDDGVTIDALIKSADEKMYAVKKENKYQLKSLHTKN